MKTLKAITSLHSAEMQYYGEYGRYGRLEDLGSQKADLISPELARGRIASYDVRLDVSAGGYQIRAWPRISACRECPTVYSNQTMAIRTSRGPEPASSSSPLLGMSQ